MRHKTKLWKRDISNMAQTFGTVHMTEANKIELAKCRLNEVFAAVSVKEFAAPPVGHVIAIRSDVSILNAVRILKENNILSAPVIDISKPSTNAWYNKYVGMVDMLGLVTYMFEVLGDQEEHSETRGDFFAWISLFEAFKTTKVEAVAEAYSWGPFVPINETATLLDAMLILGKHGATPLVRSFLTS